MLNFLFYNWNTGHVLLINSVLYNATYVLNVSEIQILKLIENHISKIWHLKSNKAFNGLQNI